MMQSLQKLCCDVIYNTSKFRSVHDILNLEEKFSRNFVKILLINYDSKYSATECFCGPLDYFLYERVHSTLCKFKDPDFQSLDEICVSYRYINCTRDRLNYKKPLHICERCKGLREKYFREDYSDYKKEYYGTDCDIMFRTFHSAKRHWLWCNFCDQVPLFRYYSVFDFEKEFNCKLKYDCQVFRYHSRWPVKFLVVKNKL